MAKQLIIPRLYPKQIEFCEADGERIGYGGAVGGGKSFIARIKCVLLALRYSGIQILLIRRTYPELYNNHVLPLIDLLKCKHPDKNEHIAEFRDSTKDFTFSNGSRIVLAYCDSVKEIFKFQGLQMDVIFMEEATLFEEEIYLQLTSRNRLSGNIQEPFTPRMYFTANPVGIGVGWFRKLFINNPQCNDGKSGIVFIQSTVYDNEFLMVNNPEYVKQLEKLPPKRKQALLYGDWDVLEGQFFEEFNPNIHVIKPFHIPKDWKVYRTRDYGFDMLACYWIAIDEQGFGYVYKEVYKSNLNISSAGNLINQINDGDTIWLDLAPPDLFARNNVDYRSTVDIFNQECGHYLTKASNDRENGCNAMREWLKLCPREELEINADGVQQKVTKLVPKLRFFENCYNVIRCIPQVIYSEKNPNDYSDQPHELSHSTDAIRYFCASWSFPPVHREEKQELNWIEKAIKEKSKSNLTTGNGGYIQW